MVDAQDFTSAVKVTFLVSVTPIVAVTVIVVCGNAALGSMVITDVSTIS